MALTRFSVPPLHQVTRDLAAVAMGSQPPDLVLRNARVLSTYSERILVEKEIWLRHGHIAAGKRAGTLAAKTAKAEYDAKCCIIVPGLVDLHIHIESSRIAAGA